MIAVDSNVLVYAHRRDSPWHREARACLSGLADNYRPWAIPWPCIHEFLSIVTHPKIYNPPSTLQQGFLQIEAWLAAPALTLIGEDSGYWPQLRDTLEAARVVGPRIHDARISALCVQHGIDELWTADRDFSRFKNVRVRNPLV